MSSSIYLVLNSDDVGVLAGSTSGDYTTTLATQFNLNRNQKWEVALVSATYPTPEPFVDKDILISCDIVSFSFFGSGLKKFIFKSDFPHTTKLANQLTRVSVKELTYFPLSKLQFSTVQATIEDTDGNPIVSDLPSSITLAIRTLGTIEKI